VYSEKGELEHIKMGCGKDDQGRCEWFKLAGRLDSEGCVLFGHLVSVSATNKLANKQKQTRKLVAE